MPYNSIVDRSGASPLIPEEASRDIIKAAVEQSVALSRFRRVTMSRKQQRIPCLAAFPHAYFVDGDTGLKQTTDISWDNKYLNAEELAAIVPIPEAVLSDSDFDIWGETRPLLAEAIGRAVDAAVFFGTSAPASWPDDVSTAVAAAGLTHVINTSTQAEGGIAEDVNQTMALMEGVGFDVSGFVTDRSMRGVLRGARDTSGQKMLDLSSNEIEGMPVAYGMRGLWPTGLNAPRLFAMDWSQFMVAVREDLTWKVLDQAVITDNAGAIVYNLAQQDMVALRLTFRVAWQVANPITHEVPLFAGDRYPAAALVNPAA